MQEGGGSWISFCTWALAGTAPTDSPLYLRLAPGAQLPVSGAWALLHGWSSETLLRLPGKMGGRGGEVLPLSRGHCSSSSSGGRKGRSQRKVMALGLKMPRDSSAGAPGGLWESSRVTLPPAPCLSQNGCPGSAHQCFSSHCRVFEAPLVNAPSLSYFLHSCDPLYQACSQQLSQRTLLL